MADEERDREQPQRWGEQRMSGPDWQRAVTNAELAIEARQLATPGAADPVLGTSGRQPAQQQIEANRTGRQLAHSDDISTPQQQREADRPEPGRTYTGRVTEITGQHVYQDVGGRTVAHDRHALTGRAARDEAMQGQTVEIRYPVGRVGLVREAPQAREMGSQSREIGGQDGAMQRDFGSRER
jgi:hypothetical protein